MMTTAVTADMLRRGRDLADQSAELKAEKTGIVFMDISKREPPITLYAMSDGEAITMPRHIAEVAIRKRYVSGAYMFTNDPDEAPPYKKGRLKCFLHAESAERLSGLLDEVGVGQLTCKADHLASSYARRIHAENRHGKRWMALQEYQKEQKEQKREEREDRQLEATLALAGTAAKAKKGKDDGVHSA
jgi:hypothetical protein